MKPSEIIRESKNVMFERGWCQGSFERLDGSVCVRGALRLSATQGARIVWTDGWQVGEAEAAAHVSTAVGGGYIPTWNDTKGRTFSEVIDALDLAEKLAMIAEERDDQHQA
jgi:hypothetical protein